MSDDVRSKSLIAERKPDTAPDIFYFGVSNAQKMSGLLTIRNQIERLKKTGMDNSGQLLLTYSGAYTFDGKMETHMMWKWWIITSGEAAGRICYHYT